MKKGYKSDQGYNNILSSTPVLTDCPVIISKNGVMRISKNRAKK